MFTTKSLLTLFAIVAGGLLNAGSGAPRAVAASSGEQDRVGIEAAKTPKPATSSFGRVPSAAAPLAFLDAMLLRESEQALLAELRKDLRDGDAGIRLSDMNFERTSNRSIEGRGHGFVFFDGANAIPIEVTVAYDLPEARIEHVSYLVSRRTNSSNGAMLGKKLRDNLADSIGSRLVLEFSQQPVDFSLLDINHADRGRNRIFVSGNGVTRFAGEGAAYTRFVATADKFSGQILTVEYELLQEMEPVSNASLATAN